MKLAQLLSPWINTEIPDCDISGVNNDSRLIQPGDLFIAYKGVLADGRLFMQKAVQSGAKAILYEAESWPKACVLPETIPCIPLEKLADKLAVMACQFYHYPSRSLSITGVTGTNGKTTIAYQLAQAYNLLNRSSVYLGTLGQGKLNAIEPLMNTTPDGLTIQKLLYNYKQQGVQHVCMEVSSHALSLHRVDGVDFNQAIYTNLSLDHLDFHRSMDAYAAAKAQLFGVPSLKWAIINHDDPYSKQMDEHRVKSCQRLTYGLQAGSDVQAITWRTTMTGSEFDVVSPWGKHQVRVNLLGAFNIYNSLAVLSSLLANGFDASQVVPLMQQLRASPGRMEVVHQQPCVIVDYAHTPDALQNALTTLAQLKQGRLLVVFGCGGDRDKSKRPIMGAIASQVADFTIITSDNPRTENPSQIIAEIEAGITMRKNVINLIDREQAIYHALEMANPDDIILIAGKGHESYQQIGHERFTFSDQAIVRNWFESSLTTR